MPPHLMYQKGPHFFWHVFKYVVTDKTSGFKSRREEEEGEWKCLHSNDMYFTDIFFLFSLDVLPAKDPEALHAL